MLDEKKKSRMAGFLQFVLIRIIMKMYNNSMYTCIYTVWFGHDNLVKQAKSNDFYATT